MDELMNGCMDEWIGCVDECSYLDLCIDKCIAHILLCHMPPYI